jgi:formamidopyrimidine-DNA glycosylase
MNLEGLQAVRYCRPMPELPEVETIRRQLEPWLDGCVIKKAQLEDALDGPKYAHLDRATGQQILAVGRRGKFLVLPLSRGDELIIHLGMTGSLGPERPTEHLRVSVQLDGHDRDVLYFRDIRRFGRFLVLPGGDRSGLPTLSQMGPEPLDEDFTGEVLWHGLRSRTSIKARLHSQKPVAGLGNIYIDEVLWSTQIHPLLPADKVTRNQATSLRHAVVQLLKKAIERQGTTLRDYRTITGVEGDFGDSLNAYGRAGAPCPRCCTPIMRIVVAQRGTHFCPQCQPEPRKRRRR